MNGAFLAGTGRSGTTILRQCLSLHDEVAAMPGELRIVIDPSGILDVYEALAERWDPYRADTVLFRFQRMLMYVTSNTNIEYKQHDLDRWSGGSEWYANRVSRLLEDLAVGKIPARWVGGDPDRQWMWETEPHDPSSLLREFVRDLYAQRNADASVFVEDTPYTGCHWETVRKVFPDSKIVFCVRHPKDIYSSFLHGGKHWTPKDPKQAAKRISNTISKTMGFIGDSIVEDVDSDNESWMMWNLEAFVSNPKMMLTNLCLFLGVSPHPATIESMVSLVDPDKAHIGRASEELNSEEEDVYNEYLSWAEEPLGYGTS